MNDLLTLARALRWVLLLHRQRLLGITQTTSCFLGPKLTFCPHLGPLFLYTGSVWYSFCIQHSINIESDRHSFLGSRVYQGY